jgi:glutaminyl-tRNA synthetase
MYDYTHCISDALEGITHSICTLEFEDHRPLYDWILDQLPVPCHPQQIEFARLNLSYTVMSKRKLLELVKSSLVSGWDDPRMPTIAGMRRRGFTAKAIRDFCDRIGVAKASSIVDYNLLQFCVREDLNKIAHRMMVVLEPLKVTIENYPEDLVEEFTADNNPEDADAGQHIVPFSKVIYIEKSDFMEEPIKGWFRLSLGSEVRLKHAYYITCKEVIKDAKGEIIELVCTYDPESKGGGTPDGRRVKGTIHWVSTLHAVKIETRIYDQLFTLYDPDDAEEGKDYKEYLNPNSLQISNTSLAEPAIQYVKIGERFQFLRHGYFIVDQDSRDDQIVFNRIVPLRDSWGKQMKKS